MTTGRTTGSSRSWKNSSTRKKTPNWFNRRNTMALKITKASDPIRVTAITTCLYAPPGIGKTSTAFTADAPLLLDFDRGAYRAANRKDAVQVERWADVIGITADDLAPYSTVIVDTAGRALDCLAADIMARNPKMGRGGALSQQGFGQLKSEFTAWLKSLRSIGKDVILIAHMDEQRQGEEIVERLDIQGSSKNEIYKSADAMGRLRFVDGKRVLDFNPSSTGFGKNPAQMQPIAVPDFASAPQFLADVIAQIKGALNALSEEAMEAMKAQADAAASFAALTTAEQFTAKVGELHDAPNAIKALLVKAAGDKGFKFDAKTRAFRAKEAA